MKKFLRKLFESKKSKEERIQVALGTMTYECPTCNSDGSHCTRCNSTGKLKDPYFTNNPPLSWHDFGF